MGGKRRLRSGLPRALGRHDGIQGSAFREAWRSLVTEFGDPPPQSLLRLEMTRCAVAWTNLEVSSRALGEARRARETGKGRRPGIRELERLARRQGLADATYSQALDKLRELAKSNGRVDLAQALAATANRGFEPRSGPLRSAADSGEAQET